MTAVVDRSSKFKMTRPGDNGFGSAIEAEKKKLLTRPKQLTIKRAGQEGTWKVIPGMEYAKCY